VTFDKKGHASVTFAALDGGVDGEVVFGADPDVAGASAVVTVAPDGTRWVGLSAIRTLAGHAGPLGSLCEALLAWGASRGASRAYLRVGDRDTHTSALAESLGFRLHHRSRYFPVRSGTWDSV
jgi:N-acetylglutamate synthase